MKNVRIVGVIMCLVSGIVLPLQSQAQPSFHCGSSSWTTADGLESGAFAWGNGQNAITTDVDSAVSAWVDESTSLIFVNVNFTYQGFITNDPSLNNMLTQILESEMGITTNVSYSDMIIRTPAGDDWQFLNLANVSGTGTARITRAFYDGTLHLNGQSSSHFYSNLIPVNTWASVQLVDWPDFPGGGTYRWTITTGATFAGIGHMVPAPGALALAGFGLLAVGRRARK